MDIPLGELFTTNELEGTPGWDREVFLRAYAGPPDGAGGFEGPFEKVRARLEQKFSVLVYLPGNCMAAAASYVIDSIKPGPWREYGKQPEKATSIADLWRSTTGIVDGIRQWLQGTGGSRHAIFHNLDLLGDGRGGIYPHVDAQTALFSLLEGTRSGVVLGLSDRDAGELPPSIERAFSDIIWIREIPRKRFHKLIPQELGGKIMGANRAIPDGAAWLIGSRLQWTDPIRAVKIMKSVAANSQCSDLGSILQEIWKSARAVEFSDPADAFPDVSADFAGFEDATVARLKQTVIEPYRNWAVWAQADRDQCKAELAMLQPGLILHGPPGTGKTLLAQKIATLVGLPVRMVSAADIKVSPWGDAERNVHRVFDAARRAAPCVLILDDGDDLVPDRSQVTGSNIAGAERGMVDALLRELQGIHGSLSGVLVIMTTNRFTAIDPAARERLDLNIRVPYPLDEAQIRQIVRNVAGKYRIRLEAKTVDVEALLVQRFISARDQSTQAVSGMGNVSDPAVRRKTDRNLFSPREIEQAMRILALGAPRSHEGYRTPSADHVDAMMDYYKLTE